MKDTGKGINYSRIALKISLLKKLRSMKNIIKLYILIVVSLTLAGCTSKSDMNYQNNPLLPATVSKSAINPAQSSGMNQRVRNNSSQPEEEMVSVNINNLGRSNPFSQFQEKSLMSGGELPSLEGISLNNIPPPPEFNPDSGISKLLAAKVSGILYDPVSPSAIINVNNSDYLVHKGDIIFDYYIKDIKPDKVTMKYGNNIHKAGLGEVIYGNVNDNPVKGYNKNFAGNSKYKYNSSIPNKLPEIKIIN